MTKLVFAFAIAIAFVAPRVLPAQSLARRVGRADGAVQFTFASRPGVCGDGQTYIRDPFDDNSRIYEGGNFSGHTRGGKEWPPCMSGPVRVVATVSKGELLRLHTYAGPRRQGSDADDLGVVSVDDASAFLTSVVEQSRGRVAGDAILPLVLADSLTPWPLFLRFARNDRVSRETRQKATFWLGRGAAAKLGVTDRDEDENDDVRNSAVFALSQQPREIAVPRLLEIARGNRHPAARAQALFWLGQTGDPRALDLFEEILVR